MKFEVLNIDGSKGSTINLDDNVFGIEPNHHVVHQAVTSELSIVGKEHIRQKIVLLYEAEVKNHGIKKVEVLQELVR